MSANGLCNINCICASGFIFPPHLVSASNLLFLTLKNKIANIANTAIQIVIIIGIYFLFFFNVFHNGNMKTINATKIYAIDFASNIAINNSVNIVNCFKLIVSDVLYIFKQYATNIETNPTHIPSIE